jgi:hypothetical protein
MNLIKILGLAGIVAAALMAFTGSASATYLTSPMGTTFTGAYELRSGGITFDGLGTTCHQSEIKGNIEFHGAGITTGGNLTSVTFGTCTGGTVTVLKKGALEISTANPVGNGTVTWTGAEILIHTAGLKCTIKTAGTHVGTLTGSNNTMGNPVLDTGSNLPVSGFLCPALTTITGVYAGINPNWLMVH